MTAMKSGREPERTCVICRRRFPKKQLKRYVCPGPDNELGALKYDEKQRLPGRGFYICDDEACRSKFAKFSGWRKKCKGV